ncbi:MAG: RNA polymerase sigma factor [Sphingobacteriia bacterium]|jgi:RNA polymerase sigma factor (sigma-70 family)
MNLVHAVDMATENNLNIGNAVKTYGAKLLGFIRKKVNSDEDAEDILQEVWYQFIRVSGSQPIEQVSAWLYRVAKNKIVDQYRKKEPELVEELFEDEDFEDTTFSLSHLLFAKDNDPATKELVKLFWEEMFLALDELPENQKMVFIGNELEDLTLQEIANQTGENLKTIISRKRYAVMHLQKKLSFFYHEFINQ